MESEAKPSRKKSPLELIVGYVEGKRAQAKTIILSHRDARMEARLEMLNEIRAYLIQVYGRQVFGGRG